MVKKSKKLRNSKKMGWYRDVLTMFLKGNYSCLSGELIIAPRTRYDLPSNTLRSFLTGCGAPIVVQNRKAT